MMPIDSKLTSSETALVNPGVHVRALILELLKLIGGVLDLVLEILDLIKVGSNGIVESFGQWIGCGLHIRRCDWTGVYIIRGHRSDSRCRVVNLVASSGWSKGLQFVLRIKTTRVLSVFVGWTLDLLLRVVIVGIFGIWTRGIHWKILVAFG